jgi:hypothetical protein
VSEWLELELADDLAPVAAPDGLWERIERRRAAERRRPARWPMAALVAALASGAALWMAARPARLDLERLAREELRHPGRLDLDSSDPAQINAFLKERAGLAVSLPRNTSAHLAGARILRKGATRMAIVEYAIGGARATLLVADAGGAGDLAHGRLSWRAGGLAYALASSDKTHSEGACLLCHSSL